MYYIHVIDELGNFELIDGELLFLYDLDESELIELTDDAYAAYIKRPHEAKYLGGQIVYSTPAVDLAELKKQAQVQIWEQIKQKRHDIARGGVYLASVDKWFHSDDGSRTQYLALQLLPALPPGLMWKTMDGTFIKLDKPLLTELAITMVRAEQQDFINAERHKRLMEQADNPLTYDYADGWSATFDSQNIDAQDTGSQINNSQSTDNRDVDSKEVSNE